MAGYINVNNQQSSNLRNPRVVTTMSQGGISRNASKKSINSARGSNSKRGPNSDRSLSDKSDKSGRREPHKLTMSNAQKSKFVLNTRTITKDPTFQDKA